MAIEKYSLLSTRCAAASFLSGALLMFLAQRPRRHLQIDIVVLAGRYVQLPHPRC